MQSPNSNHFTTTERGSASRIRHLVGGLLGLILLGFTPFAVAESTIVSPSVLSEKGSFNQGYAAITDLVKRLGCLPPVDATSFEELLQALGDCYAEHGAPPQPAPEVREGLKRDIFRVLDEIHDPSSGASAEIVAAFDNLLFQILSDVTE